MNSLKLNETHNLTLGREGKRVRIVIYKNGLEQACRKEYLSKLSRFLDSGEEKIFKGRLQLFKAANVISVEVKKELIGYASANDFLDILNSFTVKTCSLS